MAFLFKSRNKQGQGLPPANRSLTSADGTNASVALKDGSEKPRFGAQTPLGNNIGTVARGATPDQMGSHVDLKQAPRNVTSPPHRPPPDLSLYPWSQKRIEFTSPQASPFPRYGAASNSVASPKGDIYLMGGLINGSMVKGDLWMVEATPTKMSCSPVATMAEGPCSRVGHASLLVGNAFIVFGGDTKMDDMDVLDDTLYLLNTSTKHWSRALPAGPRPAGRYGHTLNILGSRIYVFGGQVEGYFFNDLVAFDLNALQQASNRWEILIHNTNDGGPPQGQSPPARTNHSIVTWNDRLFLFGGTDGVHWYNDVWIYDPRTNSWTAEDCIGFIPTPREGHAATLCGDVMYVFGGRTEEGKDLGDLAAFRIPTRRWYTFQNMGPSPSPRSGHNMTACGNYIYVVGGEPSSAPRDPAELSLSYVLDTSKIRYPSDQPQQQGVNGVKAPGVRRPSAGDRSGTPQQRSESREGAHQDGLSKWRNGSQESMNERAQPFPRGPDGPLMAGPPGQNIPARQVRGSPAPPPSGPPPGGPPPGIPMQQQGPHPKVNGIARPPFTGADGRDSPRLQQRLDRPNMMEQSPYASGRASPATRDAPTREPVPPSALSEQASRSMSPPQSDTSNNAVMQNVNGAMPLRKTSLSSPKGSMRSRRQQGSVDLTTPAEETYRTPMEQPDKTLGLPGQFPGEDVSGSSSTHTSPQTEDLTRELEILKSRNAWYASELAAARKSGYRMGSVDDFSLGKEAPDALGDEHRPLIEALYKVRNDYAQAQESVAKQSSSMAERVARAEKQRDAAIAEATQAKARSMGRMAKGRGLENMQDTNSHETNRRLASALAKHNDLNSKLTSLAAELEAERKARSLADESADAAHRRAAELDTHKQENASEIERLRMELHEAQRSAREEAAYRAEALGSAKLLQVDKNELSGKLSMLQGESKNHHGILATLREAVTSSTEKATTLERMLDHERRERGNLEEKLANLKSEHETRVVELESTSRRLQDAEELAQSHAAEARTHREAVLAGFGKSRDIERDDFAAQDERVEILQRRLEEANAMVKRNQEAADHASERLRRAEERIAGLEAYQEQASREGLGMRKQLQIASRETVALNSEKAELQQQLASHKMESTALGVQHSALRDLLHERGIDASAVARSRSADVGNQERFRELEQQLEASRKTHEDMRASFEQREQEANRGWEDKLSALDSDYQAAVKYLKGTEKMLSRLKQELHRYKASNKELEDQVSRQRKSPSAEGSPSPGWESERSSLRQELETMQTRVKESSEQLELQVKEVHDANLERDALQQQLLASREQSRADVDNLRTENTALEQRAAEAERRVQHLLDTVGTKVSNYRRESMQPNGATPAALNVEGVTPSLPQHTRDRSDQSADAESNYSLGTGHDGASDPADPASGIGRNSLALDTLASELETLRTHWETTNKNYRSSGQSVVEKTPTTATTPGGSDGFGDGLTSWRRRLDERDVRPGV